MPSTYLNLTVHVVFSTKHREPLLPEKELGRIHQYLGGTIAGLGGEPLKVGGVSDHVHLLIGLRGNHCVSDLIREIKKATTQWLRAEIGIPLFSWQEGYAAFTVCTERDVVERYIESQAEHHRTRGSMEELVELFQSHGIEYNPKYLSERGVCDPSRGVGIRVIESRGLRHPG